MTLSFPIKKRYLVQKLDEQERIGTFHERRAYKPFWRTRIGSTHAWHLGGDAVFLCGRHAFRAEVINITLDETPPGIEDVVGGSLCYNVECRFWSSELKRLSMFVDDATNEVHELIKQDVCTVFQREHDVSI